MPHNFNDPENPVHGEFVHKQLRADLFETIYMKITYLEEKQLTEDEDYFRLDLIEPIDCTVFSNFNKILFNQNTNSQNDDVIECQKWYIETYNRGVQEYSVKILQSVNDHFYS